LSELFRTLRHGEEEQQEQQEHQVEEGSGRIILSFQITRNLSSSRNNQTFLEKFSNNQNILEKFSNNQNDNGLATPPP
jgi:hypothetical protein